MAQYQLVIKRGPAPGKTFELTKNELHIGRDINNEIVINDAEISRRHCRFSLQGDAYVLEDLGSTNGTFVNEQRLAAPYTLRGGETLRLGDNVTLAYELVGVESDATVASAGAPAPPRAAAPPPPPPAQQYAGKVPAGPAPDAPAKDNRRTLLIGCGALLVVGVCVTTAFLIWVDSGGTQRWCEWFSFLLSACG